MPFCLAPVGAFPLWIVVIERESLSEVVGRDCLTVWYAEVARCPYQV
jgi:hypothetical protein